MRRILMGVLGAVLGYLVGGVAGAVAVHLLSTNTHDRALEAAMTGAFVAGPLTAVLGFILGVTRQRPPSPPVAPVP